MKACLHLVARLASLNHLEGLQCDDKVAATTFRYNIRACNKYYLIPIDTSVAITFS